MGNVWVTMEPITEGEKKGWFAPTGFHLTKPAKWHECYTVADPEAFIEHMIKYNNLPHHALNRAEYETTCAQNNVEPMEDGALDTYGMENGDFGMSHYHTVRENRQTGIANTIHQLRYRAIRDELKLRKQQAVKPAPPVKMVKCSCGHTVPSGSAMSASMGSSCPECYDRMSD